MNENDKIIIATGGTGGHVMPAVSLANYFNNKGFISTLTVDKRGLKFIDGEIIKNTRVIESSSFDKNKKLNSIFKIVIAIFNSLIFLFKTKPKFIFGMGGYGGRAILIDMENSRIVVLNSLHYNHEKFKYNHNKLLIDPIKKGEEAFK